MKWLYYHRNLQHVKWYLLVIWTIFLCYLQVILSVSMKRHWSWKYISRCEVKHIKAFPKKQMLHASRAKNTPTRSFVRRTVNLERGDTVQVTMPKPYIKYKIISSSRSWDICYESVNGRTRWLQYKKTNKSYHTLWDTLDNLCLDLHNCWYSICIIY